MNTISSGWISVASGPNLDDGLNSSAHFRQQINAPELNQSILDTGTVLVYAKISGNIFQLNYTNGDLNNFYSFIPSLTPTPNIIVDTYEYNVPDASVVPTQLRYVLIPGPTAMAMRAAHINPSSYNDVTNYLKIGK